MTGLILIDKPENMTSFSACNRVRHLLGVKKAGHTGTLDPMATGVLPVMLSNSTRFISLLPTHDKSYSATARLGVTTDTLDITGKILSEAPVNVTENQLLSAIENFMGDILQTPPMYSAISKDGKRLYDLARQGIEIEREKRHITIKEIKLTSFDNNSFSIDVDCSAGTYIRSLCDDIGNFLGCGATLSSLRRTCANGFSINDCITLEKLEEAAGDNSVKNYIKSVDLCFEQYRQLFVTSAQANRFHNGGSLFLSRLNTNCPVGLYRVYSPDNSFLGIGEVLPESDILSVKRVFVDD